jgi:hypothetical protein
MDRTEVSHGETPKPRAPRIDRAGYRTQRQPAVDRNNGTYTASMGSVTHAITSLVHALSRGRACPGA